MSYRTQTPGSAFRDTPTGDTVRPLGRGARTLGQTTSNVAPGDTPSQVPTRSFGRGLPSITKLSGSAPPPSGGVASLPREVTSSLGKGAPPRLTPGAASGQLPVATGFAPLTTTTTTTPPPSRQTSTILGGRLPVSTGFALPTATTTAAAAVRGTQATDTQRFGPQIEVNRTKMAAYNSYKDKVGLIKHSVLTYIITNDIDSDRKSVQDAVDKTLPLWILAFTDDSRSSMNMEALENFGDKILGACLSEFIHRKKPNLTPEEATGLISYYAGNSFNSALLRSITDVIPTRVGKDGKYVTSKGSLVDLMFYDAEVIDPYALTNVLAADLYEAIVATLYRCGDSIYQGKGWMWCMKFINKMYESKIDLTEIVRADPLNDLRQMFERFKYTKPNNRFGPDDGTRGKGKAETEKKDGFTSKINYKITFGDWIEFIKDELAPYLTPQQRERARNMTRTDVIGEATELDSSTARKTAGQNGLNNLEQWFGLTPEVMSIIKNKYDGEMMNTTDKVHVMVGEKGGVITKLTLVEKRTPFSQEKGLYDAVKIKLEYEGYDDHEIDKPAKKNMTSNRTVLYMNGLRGGKRFRLANAFSYGASTVNPYDVKKTLYKKYLEQQ